jgi:IS30 family transposase
MSTFFNWQIKKGLPMAKQYTQPTTKERYNLEPFIQEGYSNKKISKKLSRSKSTIGREIRRDSVCKQKLCVCSELYAQNFI